ncbi:MULTISPECIES: HAMP domain-containing sensor histidine kinase [Halorussus]|uniref:sensor histidine kinase n=1 Tax=Halorussus TaxID=1070314 RepID=UPI000E20F668|nr:MULTISPECIES: HAMP domain-containing sensor histidine kinase [Halorussus]NHN58677.1 HAMP domain-containing histidine kinase [Halorussus sp. JP-T4]
MFSPSDVSVATRRAVPLGRWSVVGLGGGLLAASVSYVAVDGRLTASEVVRFGVPIGLALFVVALGVWLRTAEVPADLVGVVCCWSLAGGAAMGLLAGWTSLLQTVEGRRMLQPASIVLTKVAVGALAGGLLGLYYSRLQQRTDELAEQRNRLDEFASIVSHDLRNPMNVAQGHLELARKSGEERHFQAVEDAHDRMERLVDEVLALSRRGDTVDDPTPVDLGSVAEEAWATVETPAMDLRIETDRSVVSDGRRLRALFENLFRNSVEHGSTDNRPSADDAVEHGSTSPRSQAHEDAVEHGFTGNQSSVDDAVEHGSTSPRSQARQDAAEYGGGTVVVGAFDAGFFVADDGPGIPPEDRERVFEGGYSTRPDGTGFGLPIVRRIAEAHDWEIRVTESAEGGARFEFAGVDGE